jgi:GT2 family glycosyltransferase
VPESVASVVVTRDRRELLQACLAALRAQTHPLERMIVVDSASSDGTPDMLRAERPDVQLIALDENVGGAGGFHTGMAAARELGVDWVWLLDDDTIPRPDALAQLLAAPWREHGLPEPSLLSSRANWTDGEPHPMNRPILRRRDPQGLVDAAAAGLLPLRTATFVSLLVSKGAIERHGLPLAHFFFQADDIEFTARILRAEHGYFVPGSVVEHRTKSAHVALDDPLRFYHHLRNTIYMMRGAAWAPAEKAALGWLVVDSAAKYLAANRGSRESVVTVGRAVRDGALR